MKCIESVKRIHSRSVDLSAAEHEARFISKRKTWQSLAVTAAVPGRNQFVIRLQLRICVSFGEN